MCPENWGEAIGFLLRMTKSLAKAASVRSLTNSDSLCSSVNESEKNPLAHQPQTHMLYSISLEYYPFRYASYILYFIPLIKGEIKAPSLSLQLFSGNPPMSNFN